ncbi:MAG TPA: hypothetical protein VN840_05025 [Streptosporangiaceae bacterium]|nr:hypothetical protein [Streptosporangiaceae bacterium]
MAAILSAGIAVVVTGCSQAGGATTSCGSYEGMNSGDRVTTIQNMMKTYKQNLSEGNVLLTTGSVNLFCAVHSSDAEISGIYGG